MTLKRSEKKLAFAGPSMTQKEADYVAEAVKHGWYETFHMHVQKLKTAVSSYLGVKYVHPTHCCTLALHLSCEALGLKEGDEVICTDSSWVATAHAIAYTGATPVFVDIDPDTWCIDPEAIRRAITPRSKAIMLVHMFGHPARMDEIMVIAKQHNLKVIEDAAPSLGAEYKGRKTGTFGDFGCFSFQGAKIAVSGEGGVICTNDEALYKRAILLSEMGRTDSKSTFWSDHLGFQYTMGNISAALALAQVERIDELVAIKRRIFGWYYDRLKDVEGIKVIKEAKDCKSNYCYPSILLQESIKTERDEVLRQFKDLNIHARPGFPRMSQMPMYEARFPNPEADKFWKRGVSLPGAANLNEEDVDFVCRALKEAVKR
jgi:perosamine synthetase